MTDKPRFEQLLDSVNEYGAQIGITKEFILDLYRESSDWAFIIKVDALHETAARGLISRRLLLRGPQHGSEIVVDGFIEALPYQGRSSVMQLLKVSGCPADFTRFIEAVRRVRNAFVHDVRATDSDLIDVIFQRGDGSELLFTFSFVERAGYDEVRYINMVREDRQILRFPILQQSMSFLSAIHENFPAEELPPPASIPAEAAPP